jgi:hypothetical protein
MHTNLEETPTNGGNLDDHAVVFVGKNPFFLGHSCCLPQPYLAGHTVGFTAPMISMLVRQQVPVTFLTFSGMTNIPPGIADLFPAPPDCADLSIKDVAGATEPKLPCPFPSLSIASHIMRLSRSRVRHVTVLVVCAYVVRSILYAGGWIASSVRARGVISALHRPS